MFLLFASCLDPQPYGSLLPGAVVAFSTTDRNGREERNTGISYVSTVTDWLVLCQYQLSPPPPPPPNHTHTAVMHPGSPYQLPFIVFGLGETPNFIEDLTIGAGHASGSNGSNRTAGYHQWASLVPNSQVIVITTPPDNPGRYGWLAWTVPLVRVTIMQSGGVWRPVCVSMLCLLQLL